MDFLYYPLFLLFLLIAVFMILLILIQKGRGGGLSSAFGGGGGNTAFGAKTGDVLTWATAIVFGLFLVLAIALNLLANSKNAKEQVLVAPTTPGANTAPANAPAVNLPGGGTLTLPPAASDPAVPPPGITNPPATNPS